MNIKKISRLLIILITISIMIISCDNMSTNNSSTITNIIETDGYGNLTGEIDDDYWSEIWPDLVRTYVGNNITVSNVHIELDHYDLSGNLIIKNYSIEDLIIYSSIISPFIVNPDSLLIQSNSQEEITISLPYIDSSEVFQEELIILSYSEDLITNHDNIIVEISAVYDGNPMELPILYGVCPAYPNPSSSLVLLPFVLEEAVDASLYIRNNAGEVVKLLAEEHFYSDIINEVIWDLKDNSEIMVSPGIYEAVLELGSEDILGTWTLRVIN
ncbi:MAG: hypothetical protein K9N06_05040 [Candidatus Cloacimonetes bacterium]|nr:hypothetical protein [Candidatus Cloacimonadota bacterium]